MPKTTPRHSAAQGFTLVEALLASVILAMAITAVTAPFTAAARNERADGRRTVAVCLANEIMEEIISKPFDDPDGKSAVGPESGESTRSEFDNIDDYHRYEEKAGAIVDGTGTLAGDPLAGDLSRHVTTTYIYVSGQDMSDSPDFVRVEVTVRRKGLPLVTLTRLAYRM